MRNKVFEKLAKTVEVQLIKSVNDLVIRFSIPIIADKLVDAVSISETLPYTKTLRQDIICIIVQRGIPARSLK